MRLKGHFKDVEQNIIYVEILNSSYQHQDINLDTSTDVKFTEDPVEITTNVDDTFSVLIKRQATLRLLSKIYLGDFLFASNAESIVVNIYKNNVCVFAGFVTPNTFNQNYSHEWEEIEITCNDYLGILEYKSLLDTDTYENLKADTDMRMFKWFLDKMGLCNTKTNIANYPNVSYQETNTWVTAGYMKKDGKYYELEKQVNIVNQDVALETGQYRLGQELQATPVPSTDTTVDANVKYNKDKLYVTVNGIPYNTGDYQIGVEVPSSDLPQVVSTQERLVGYVKGSIEFRYYEQFVLDFVMSDGSIKQGYEKQRGDIIPLSPLTSDSNSTYEFRQGSASDLIKITHPEGDTDDELYYKEYAWVRVNDKWTNTGDYRQGNLYVDEAEPDEG